MEEFLVEFDVEIPDGAPESEVEERQEAEATAAAELATQGHLVRIWRVPAAGGKTRTLGLYRADDQTQLEELLAGLPLYDWMRIAITPLAPHPNDPAQVG